MLAGGAVAAGTMLSAGRGVRAQGTPPVIRLGVMSDYSGPYRDWSGPTNLACVQQAVEEFRAQRPDIPVEVINADHQNKTDVGAHVVREWFDRRDVDAVVDVNNSAIGLAVSNVVRDKNKAFSTPAPRPRR